MQITTYGRKAVASPEFQKEVVYAYVKLGSDSAVVLIALTLCANQYGNVEADEKKLALFITNHIGEIEAVLYPLIMERNGRN